MPQAQVNQTVTMSEIARAAGVSNPTASIWRKRYENFPDPLPESSTMRPLFRLSDVEDWYIQQFPDREPLGLARRVAAEAQFAMASILRSIVDPSDLSAVITGFLAWHAVSVQAESAETIVWNGVTLDAESVPSLVTNGTAGERSNSSNNYAVEFHSACGELDKAGLHDIVLLIEPLARGSLDQRNLDKHVTDLVSLVERLDSAEIVAAANALIAEPHRGYHPSSPAFTRLASSLVDAQPSTVWDPAAGSGNLLGAAHELNPAATLTGTEISPVLAALAAARAYLNGWPATIRQGDAFLAEGGKYDAVLIDSPLGVRLDPRATELLSRQLGYPPIPASRSDIAWVCLAAAHLSEAGTGVVVTTGVTTSGKGAIADTRRALVTDGAIKAVVRLPRSTSEGSARRVRRDPGRSFRTDTMAELFLWVIAPRDSVNRIVFVDGPELVDASESETISAIATAVQSHEDSAGVICVDTLTVLKRADVPLNPDAWLPTKQTAPTDQLHQIDQAVEQLKAQRATIKLDLPALALTQPAVRLIPLTDVARVSRGRHIASAEIHDEPKASLVPLVKPSSTGIETLGYVSPAQSPRLLEPQDILVTDGTDGPIATIWDQDQPAVAHHTATVVRPNLAVIDPAFLRMCLTGPQAAETRTGSTIKRLNLKEAGIPDTALSVQRTIAQAIKTSETLIDQLRAITGTVATWRHNAVALASSGALDVPDKSCPTQPSTTTSHGEGN